MSKSKCTCQHRILAHVKNANHPHEEHCYYHAVLRQEAQDRKTLHDARTLYAQYRRAAKAEVHS